MARRLFLLDGHSLLHRAYYALPSLTTTAGEPTNAVYGFTMMLNRLLDDYNPTSVFIAFDVATPTFRHESYQEYKANRQRMPDDLRPQVETLKQVLDARGIPRLELPGYEADDVLGTAARQAQDLGYEVYIVTGDKDALQLISDKTSVLLTKRGIKDTELMDTDALHQRFGLSPSQIPDLKGLMGDSSDNIPGVPGVGEKTALKLLHTHGSIDKVYEQIDTVKGKLRERLAAHQDQALLSRDLATIRCDVPIEISIDETPQGDAAALAKLYTRLEFRGLLEQLDTEVPQSEDNRELTVNVLTADTVASAAKTLSQAAVVAVDVTDEAVFLACDSDSTVWRIALQDLHTVEETVTEALHRSEQIYCTDSKRLYTVLPGLSIAFDVVLAGYVLDPGASFDLSSLSVRYGSLPPLAQQQDPVIAGALRVLRALELSPLMQKKLQEDQLDALYQSVELPLAKLLAEMEKRGITVNPGKLEELSREMEGKLSALTSEIHEEAGECFNINSPKQLGVILFEKLGLPVIKKTKTGPSTDAEVLDQLGDHPIVAKILNFRQITKLKSTYTDALAALIAPTTGRIHTTFNQMITATGRLSSANPNLQNIPIRTDEGKRIREAFEPRDGWSLLAADYSQIELRVLAHIAGDPRMIDAFNQGLDIHAQTASEVLGIPLDAVSSKERSAAKAINFGIVYGISSYGLAKGTHLSRAKAQDYIDTYFARYPKVKDYMDAVVKQAQEQGFVTTLLHRRRYLPDINDRNRNRRSFAERMAMNTPIQGSAADIIKLAMLHVNEALVAEKLQAELLLQVHDELVLEVPQEEIATAASLVKHTMESVMDLAVRLDVDVSVGPNWKDVKPYQEVN